VVFVDVNQLKYINDNFGHAAGDFALMEIAKRLAASIRATDVAARIGGDEFGLILDQSTEEGARAQVERLRGVLAATPAQYDGHEFALSACFGVAMLQSGMTESDILAAADRDMYKSKQRQDGPAGHR
jgi:diguanylate cyclase (GGDEF)-like protein